MSNNVNAIRFLTQMYSQVWAPFSLQGFRQYYDKKVIAQSGNLTLNFSDLEQHITQCRERFSYAQPNFHNIMAVDDQHIVAWFTQAPIDPAGKPAYLLNTMANYHLKNDKIVKVDFMWDKPANFVMKNLAALGKTGVQNAKTDIEDRLTRRELECFFYIIQGKTAKQIAQALQLSYRTVETYIENMKIKLGLTTIAQVMEYAIANGFVAISPLLSQTIHSL